MAVRGQKHVHVINSGNKAHIYLFWPAQVPQVRLATHGGVSGEDSNSFPTHGGVSEEDSSSSVDTE